MVDGYADQFADVDVDRVLDALRLMRRASLLIRELEAYFARHDREPERNCLAASEIAERLDVSRPVVTRTLQGLERAGLIAISENSEDARSRNVTLTLSGKAKLDEVLPGYFAILHRPDPAADK